MPTLRSTLLRFAAYLLDCAILFLGVLATQAAVYFLGLNPIANRLSAGEVVAGWQLHLWVFATVSVPFWFYFALQHSSAGRATLGKRWLGLRVNTLAGERLTLRQALARAILTLIPFEFNHFVLFQLGALDGSPPSALFWSGTVATWLLIALYVGLLLVEPRRRSLPDLVVGSLVTSTPSR